MQAKKSVTSADHFTDDKLHYSTVKRLLYVYPFNSYSFIKRICLINMSNL